MPLLTNKTGKLEFCGDTEHNVLQYIIELHLGYKFI